MGLVQGQQLTSHTLCKQGPGRMLWQWAAALVCVCVHPVCVCVHTLAAWLGRVCLCSRAGD